MARIIGALAIILVAGGSAFGQFIVQPMKLVVPVTAGRRVPLEVAIENTSTNAIDNVTLRLTDLTQDANGIWQIIEADSTVDRSRLRSCRSWLHLAGDSVEVRPLARVPLRMYVEVPVGTRGWYCGALVAQAPMKAEETEGVTTAMILEFVVPIILNVQGRPMPQKVQFTNAGLEFRPQSMDSPAATFATLTVKNDGGTYSMLKAYSRVWHKLGGRWRKIADMEYPGDASIIPGAEFTMRRDIGRPLPAGEYKVDGYLYVDGAPASDIRREFEFKGDTRARPGEVKTGIALDLDTRQLTLETVPGQTRTGTILVVNGSEDQVAVDVTVGLPEHMEGTVWENIRGDQFACVDWLEVTPAQFTLQGRQRLTLRVVSNMPASANQANYYAAITLQAKFPDGQEAGRTNTYVCVGNKSAQQVVRVAGMAASLAELTPGRYIVTARFGNFGDTHVQASCQGVLTTVPGDQTAAKMVMETVGEGGFMLPLEIRPFNGVLDIAGVPAGRYRLTAVLMHDKGEPVQSQTAIEIMDTAQGKVLKQLDVAMVGGPVPISLK